MNLIIVTIAIFISNNALADYPSDIELKCSTVTTKESFIVKPFEGKIIGKYNYHSDAPLRYDYDGYGNEGYVLSLAPENSHPNYYEWNESFLDGVSISFERIDFKTGHLNNDLEGSEIPVGSFEITCVETTDKTD